jgi:choline dehydrogenase-like flavoprotein
MIIDAEELPTGSAIQADTVIVGGGMAGIALARQLADAGFRVAILESGGEGPDPRVQDLYAGTMTVGAAAGSERLDEYLTASRVRCFGGSGNVWGAKCGPLDPIDFERRAWVPHSGWPISRVQLQPFYDRACDLLELPRFAVPASDPEREPLFDRASPAFTRRTRAYTRYTGALPGGPYKDYKAAASTHARIAVYLHANVTRIAMAADGRQVQSMEVRTLNGRVHIARGATYVLATGGIENVRLMLASNDVVPQGIGNHSDWLGRGFQGHSTVVRDNTSLWTTRPAANLADFDITATDRPHTVLGVSDALQRKTGHLNFTVTMTGPVRKADAASAAVTRIAQQLSSQADASHRSIYFMTEHAPDRDSRITLDLNSRDALGLPRVRLDMRHGQLELDTLEQSTTLLARELGRLGLGRLRWAGSRQDWTDSLKSLSRHHMGATRMATSPADGVVDEYGRVHGVANLYVAGSSVFPTSGITNPTLTLLALGFRMGDRMIAEKGRAA